MNTATFAGNLGRDSEVRQTNSGSVTNFSVAVKMWSKDGDRTLWVSCAMWGDRGEKVAPYLLKGTAVTVSGDVDLRQYDKKDGSAGAELTLNVQRLTLQGSRGSRDGEGASPSPSPSRQEKTPQQADREKGKDDFGDEEIPF